VSTVKISFIKAGFCTHPEKVAYANGSWKSIAFPASVAVIEHPKEGIILFDTGYSEAFFKATQAFPNILYRWITPVFLDDGQTAKAQLKAKGINPSDVRTIILSHFHADHIGAVSDFPKARYIYQQESFAEVKALRGFSALRKAFLPALLPDDFLDRSLGIEGLHFSIAPHELNAFSGAYDVFKDGSLWLVMLPGHSEGHIGLFVRTQEQDYLLTGDACYVRENFIEDSPSSFVTRLIFSNFKEYKTTLHKMHQFSVNHPKAILVPCHCTKTLEKLPKFEREYVASPL
jgi:glyoxylase-like metal-dependent hydrolase (beta-lactamase superfamily II)